MKVLVIVFCLLVLTSCAAKSVRCRNCPKRVTPIIAHFNSDYCKDLPDYKFECNHVVFEPVTLPLK